MPHPVRWIVHKNDEVADGDAAQTIEELDFRPMFNELRERLIAQSIHDAHVEFKDALGGSSLTAHASPNTPEMSTVSRLANDAAVRTRCARSDPVEPR